MTGSRARYLLCTAALAALLAPAWGQWIDNKPPVLEPDDYPPVATEDPPDKPVVKPAKPTTSRGPVSTTGATAEPQPLQNDTQVAPLPPATGGRVPLPTPVQVDALGTPEGPPVGTLDSSNGGLGDHIWSGSERAKAENLLARTPLVSADPALRDLAKRLVLTRASAPPGQAKKAFVTMRIERLLDAGLIAQAGEIAAQASVSNDEGFARVQANAVLTANRAQDACGSATAARQTEGDVFWMQLRAYCATVSGDTATAQLTRDVLKAQGIHDPAYDTLVEDILNKKAVPPGAIANPTALHVFLLQQAGLPVPELVARKMGTAENLLAARDTRNSARSRFEAAERIVNTGALSVSELKAIADAQDLPLNRVANAAADAPSLPFFMGQVLLRRAATVEGKPDEKTRLASVALSLGDKAGMLPLAAALQSDVIASIKPTPANHEYARVFARALLLAGRADAAAKWTNGDAVMKVLVAFASQEPQRIAAIQPDLSAFAMSLAKNPPDPDPDRSYKALVLGLADVLGLTMPPDAKAAAANVESQSWDGRRPGPGQLRTIQQVSLAPDRRGEALLMLLDAIQSNGLKDQAPDVTIEYVRLLAAMDQPKAAHAIAMDALFQYVPPPLLAKSASVQ